MIKQLATRWLKSKIPGSLLFGALIIVAVGLAVSWRYDDETDAPPFAGALRQTAVRDGTFIAVNNPPPFTLRDPFRVRAPQSTVQTVPKAAEPAAKAGVAVLPQSKAKDPVKAPNLTGTVFNDTKRLAIIEYQQQSVVCHEGDRVGGYVIATIEERSVRLIDPQGSLMILEVGR